MLSDGPRVRFAPSPTGYLHVGGARTALFNWLFARQKGGKFVLRMEDTDAARNTPEARETIFAGLRWLGLEPDEGPEQGGAFGPYSQSERQDLYVQEVANLRSSGAAYPCFCSRERLAALRAEQEANKSQYGYDGLCKKLSSEEVEAKLAAGETATLRLNVPAGETVIKDMIRGEVKVNHADIEDIILVRGDGNPVYNLVVVIDDHHMGITHVLRGEDHLTNTFKQAILYQAMGWEMPEYGHLPLILGAKGSGKLSKRKHPEAALEHYMEQGYHPEAVVNWLALMGWSFDDKTEIMSRDELVERFQVERIQKGGARLNLEKLASLSGEYIRQMSKPQLAEAVKPFLAAAGALDQIPAESQDEKLLMVAKAWHERLESFSQIVAMSAWVFTAPTEYIGKASKNLLKGENNAQLLRDYAAFMPNPLPADPSEHEALARSFAEKHELGFGKLVHPLRAAWTGEPGGPPLFDCADLIGVSEAHSRLLAAADWIDKAHEAS